jgi:hypothetical protein
VRPEQGGRAAPAPRSRERGGARTTLLLAVVFLLGLAACGFWLYTASQRSQARAAKETGDPQPAQLTEATRAVLARLDAPLEIRFYALLDPATVPASVSELAGRVEHLLAAYQQEGGGKIKVTSFNFQSNLNPNAAPADGIHAFNMERGEACYLGIAVALKGRKELLPRLYPEWEQALEPDLTRAITRLLEASQPIPAPVAVSQMNTSAVQEVKALIPNLPAVSVDEGKRILQEAAHRDFTAAARQMQAQVKEAEQQVSQALNGGSDADKQAARQNLLRIQAEQTEKLQQIAAQSKAQMDALEQLKAGTH